MRPLLRQRTLPNTQAIPFRCSRSPWVSGMIHKYQVQVQPAMVWVRSECDSQGPGCRADVREAVGTLVRDAAWRELAAVPWPHSLAPCLAK